MKKQTDDLPLIVRFPKFVKDKSTVESDEQYPYNSQEHWCYVLSEIRRNLFTTTSATVSSPSESLFRYQQQLNSTRIPYYDLFADFDKKAVKFSFNADSFAAKDIFMYRQLRSEHILIRMANNLYANELSYTFSRLSRGIFLVQKYQQGEPVRFPTHSSLDVSEVTLSIDSFTFKTLFNDMKQQTVAHSSRAHHTTIEGQRFVPFTYTLGVRYTNPYEGSSDIVVRGNIPLWCQTLFITECLRQLPILPDTIHRSLLPFLKNMPFRFTKFNNRDAYPEMAVIYERFALELCDPRLLWQNNDDQGNTWNHAEHQILNTIVLCDISDEQAELITIVATEWAMSQNITM